MSTRIAALTLCVVMAACGAAETVETDSTEPTALTTAEATEPTTAAGAAPVIDLQGHRGARGLKPENTLPSFEVALDTMVTTLELDLHFSADGKVIVWHDPVIDEDKCGAPDGSGLPDPDDPLTSRDDLAVRNLNADQLRGYRCDRNPDRGRFPDQDNEATSLAGADFGIVTLAEVLAFIDRYAASELKTSEQRANAAAVRVNVETKRIPDSVATIGDGFDGTNAGPFELAVLQAIDEWGHPERAIIQSFDHRSLWAIAAIRWDLDLAPLTREPGVDVADLAERGASIWSPRSNTVDAELLEAAHAAGLLVVPWTVNDPGLMQQLIDLGVDGIITDRPDLFPG